MRRQEEMGSSEKACSLMRKLGGFVENCGFPGYMVKKRGFWRAMVENRGFGEKIVGFRKMGFSWVFGHGIGKK